MDSLRDIKPFIELSDYSLYILIITILVGLLFGMLAFKKGCKSAKKNCKIDCQKYYLSRLKSVDWTLPKVAAYEATFYGRLLAQDKRRKELFLQMKSRLDKLKYAKDSAKVDSEIMRYYNLYKQVCDESI
jgi:hypothetical protein